MTPEILPREVTTANMTQCKKQVSNGDEDTAKIIFFFFIGKYMVLLLSCFQMILEVKTENTEVQLKLLYRNITANDYDRRYSKN